MVKVKISTKLFFTYCIILIISFSITSIFFNLLAENYLVRAAKKQLTVEGEKISELVKNATLSDDSIREKLAKRRELKIVGSIIDAQIIIFNNNNDIIFTNIANGERPEIIKLLETRGFKRENYVNNSIPIVSDSGEVKGKIILFTRLKDLNGVRRLLSSTQFVGFIFAGLMALLFGWLFGRSLNKPLKQLMTNMDKFSLKGGQFQELQIKTGDELEELANCFNQMAVKLKKADEQQIKFMQNISHELKTPLMSIQGYAEAIKDGVIEGQEVEESLDIIVEESKRLKRIVEELIYLSKLENGPEESFELSSANLNNIIDKAIKSVKALAQEKAISFHYQPILNHIGKYDEEKLKRAFINILGNAVRYANEKISITEKLEGNNMVIEISDDGPGFKEGEEKKVFDRFYKGIKGGTGIGLAITKTIIEGHQGTIEAYNNKPQGALFKIVLPLS